MAFLKLKAQPIQGGIPEVEVGTTDFIVNPGSSVVYIQAEDEIDLTEAGSTVVIPAGTYGKNHGGATVIPIQAWAVVTDATTGASVITIEDSDGVDSGIVLSIATTSPKGMVGTIALADEDEGEAIDNTAKGIVATVSTAATAGKAKVIVACLLVK